MVYEVRYKKLNSLFWKKAKRVKGDFIADDLPSKPRVLIFEDEERLEIPTDGMMFKFSSARFLVIRQQMEREAGQTIPT